MAFKVLSSADDGALIVLDIGISSLVAKTIELSRTMVLSHDLWLITRRIIICCERTYGECPRHDSIPEMFMICAYHNRYPYIGEGNSNIIRHCIWDDECNSEECEWYRGLNKNSDDAIVNFRASRTKGGISDISGIRQESATYKHSGGHVESDCDGIVRCSKLDRLAGKKTVIRLKR